MKRTVFWKLGEGRPKRTPYEIGPRLELPEDAADAAVSRISKAPSTATRGVSPRVPPTEPGAWYAPDVRAQYEG